MANNLQEIADKLISKIDLKCGDFPPRWADEAEADIRAALVEAAEFGQTTAYRWKWEKLSADGRYVKPVAVTLPPVMSEERTNKFLDEIIAESDRRKKAATCTACKCNGGTHLTTCPMVQPGDFVWEVPAPVFTLTDGVLSPGPGDEQPPPIDYANRPPRGGYF